MAQLTAMVEYGMHCLLWLATDTERTFSVRELAELQGVSASFLAKIFPRLEKAGLVVSSGGVRGGYRLARPPGEISFLAIVDALEGRKPLFQCQEIRTRCALFGNPPPRWASQGTCAIHATLLRAEKAMRDALAAETLADVARTFGRKAPATFARDVARWLDERGGTRGARRRDTDKDPAAAVTRRRTTPKREDRP